ncbi:PucR family transcriptional regulator [Motilibacter deserti]|uniref:PucR family transcriptional regulator n=1 Tax=Motilibacter deserti TaxID=2714956 RepID=A0ABX0GV09_9ACTN|nr:PucR family transcriptional regulator [Motilibacter deserti]NHC14749.1 PucR family transcriptional regulator [Motilibacter deserti]
MSAQLQRIVDGLAARVRRPVLIEDRRQRVIVYSEQAEPMDAVRRLSILRRQTTPEVVAWFRAAGINQARGPIRTPGSEELGILPRVCVPVWHRDLLLGYVWFIDADRSMSDDEIGAVSDATTDLALALYRENLANELASQRETESVRLLLGEHAEARRHAAQALLDDGLFTSDGPVTALVALLRLRPDSVLDDDTRLGLEQALSSTIRWAGPRAAVHLLRYDHAVLVLAGHDRPGNASVDAVAEHLHEAVAGATRRMDGVVSTVVGVGQRHARLVDARTSYDEALQSARVAVHLPSGSRVAHWSQLGIYRVLSQLSGDSELGGAVIHPGLDRLFAEESARPLLETLETYLDLAGNAHATAERLRLHRTSLYYRLQRLEQMAGTDLKDGSERLCLHLALKLARLTGRYEPRT